ncbi:MAG: HRDC domain-containing protein [Gemmatimonadota bacterium]
MQWRDATALALDRATFRVVGNETLFELARLAPREVARALDPEERGRGILR